MKGRFLPLLGVCVCARVCVPPPHQPDFRRDQIHFRRVQYSVPNSGFRTSYPTVREVLTDAGFADVSECEPGPGPAQGSGLQWELARDTHDAYDTVAR